MIMKLFISTQFPLHQQLFILRCFSATNKCQKLINNHYEVLGIERKASQAEIKNAFYKLSKRYHPDVLGSNDGDGSAQKFLQIREAYDILRDEQKRRIYDRQLIENTAAATSNNQWDQSEFGNLGGTRFSKSSKIRNRNETSWQRNQRRQQQQEEEEEEIKVEEEKPENAWTKYQRRVETIWERETNGWRWRKNYQKLTSLLYLVAVFIVYFCLHKSIGID